MNVCQNFALAVNKINISSPEKTSKYKNVSKANYTGSRGGREVADAKVLCRQYDYKLGLHYKSYFGDGDSKGFVAVMENKPYDNYFQ